MLDIRVTQQSCYSKMFVGAINVLEVEGEKIGGATEVFPYSFVLQIGSCVSQIVVCLCRLPRPLLAQICGFH